MRYRIPEEIKTRWTKDIGSIMAAHLDRDDILRACGSFAALHLSDLLVDLLRAFEMTGVITLSNIPVHNVDATSPPPLDTDALTLGAASVLGVTQILGFNPFSYLQEKGGCLIHDITPVPDREGEQSSNGRADFHMHTDCAWLKTLDRPQVLSLACIDNQSRTGTRLASLKEAIGLLDQSDVSVLESSSFLHGRPATFEFGKEKSLGPIIFRDAGHLRIRAAFYACHPMNDAAAIALEHLRKAIDHVSYTMDWEPGDLILFDNGRFMHGRSSVHGHRWLLRCYGSKCFAIGERVDLRRVTWS